MSLRIRHSFRLIEIRLKTAEVLNNFFSNKVISLKIPEYENLNLNFENIKDPVFKAIFIKTTRVSLRKEKNQKTQNLLFMKLTMKKL